MGSLMVLRNDGMDDEFIVNMTLGRMGHEG